MSQHLPVLITGAGLVASLGAAVRMGKSQELSAAVGVMIISHIFYLVSCWLFQNKAGRRWKWICLGVAVAARLAVFPMEPALSEDVLRYRWEGMIQAEGQNPYLVKPDLDIPGRGFRAGYGPLLEFLEWGNYEVASWIADSERRQAFWMKLTAVVFELGTLALLARLPARQLIWYAWAPAPVLEFWWNGHNDAVAVFFVVAALVAVGQREWLVWLALGLGIAAKWWPLVLAPVLVRGRWRWSWTTILPVLVLGSLYWTGNWQDYLENVQFMSGFVGGWRNNDGIFGALLWVTGDVYRAKYLGFGLLAAWVAWLGSWCRWSLERKCLAAIVALLMISANCHPWYLTWWIPFLVWEAWPPLLLWAGLMPLVYEVLAEWWWLRNWQGSTAERWWIWVPVWTWMGWCLGKRIKSMLEKSKVVF